MKKGIFTRIRNSTFGGNNYVGNLSHIVESSFGRYSYCGSRCELIRVKIGSYCSIASNVEVIYGKHPSKKWVSTHPAFYSIKTACGATFVEKNMFDEHEFVDEEKHYVLIGNDVWIGHGVKILEGVSIGDGAIIATGSVITKNVPPYAIIGGNPAKIIKKRFKDEEIDFLLSFKWWQNDEKWIRENVNKFSDISTFMEYMQIEKNNVKIKEIE